MNKVELNTPRPRLQRRSSYDPDQASPKLEQAEMALRGAKAELSRIEPATAKGLLSTARGTTVCRKRRSTAILWPESAERRH
jgi:hypothetical protein